MEREQFNLTKVKLLPSGGVSAEYTITEEVAGEVVTTDYAVTRASTPHPDLLKSLADLRAIVAHVFRFDTFTKILEDNSELVKASILQETADAFGEILDGITIRGIAWSGTGNKKGIVITALFDVGNGVKTAINTPRIRLDGESYGFEEVLGQYLGYITNEVFEYLFNGKQAQLSLFGETGEELAEEEAVLMEGE